MAKGYRLTAVIVLDMEHAKITIQVNFQLADVSSKNKIMKSSLNCTGLARYQPPNPMKNPIAREAASNQV
jgi:hypothetical protein